MRLQVVQLDIMNQFLKILVWFSYGLVLSITPQIYN
jgi:hypothetical protein